MRINLFAFFTAAVLLLAGCSGEKEPLPENVVVAGLPPVAWIAQEIGGNKIVAVSLLPEGRSPHDYAPGPSVLRKASGAKLFLSTGMPFEKSAERSLAGKTPVIDASAGIERVTFDESGNANNSCGHHHHHADGSSCSADGSDPHVWLSADNASAIARNVAEALKKCDPANSAEYERNCAALVSRFAGIKSESAKSLAPYRGRIFFVYHPAFGYFAKEYGLKQHSVELDGREVSASRLAQVIKEAKQHNVKVIFTQMQFNPRNSAVLAREIGGRAVEIDPLAFDLAATLKNMTDSLVSGFGGTK
jgi:zinc transport system substrate-binding protein